MLPPFPPPAHPSPETVEESFSHNFGKSLLPSGCVEPKAEIEVGSKHRKLRDAWPAMLDSEIREECPCYVYNARGSVGQKHGLRFLTIRLQAVSKAEVVEGYLPIVATAPSFLCSPLIATTLRRVLSPVRSVIMFIPYPSHHRLFSSTVHPMFSLILH